MSIPAVSVLLPVHNGLPYLRDAVQSVLDQSYNYFEFLIIDDGSTDGSGELLDHFARNDKRIRLIRRENKGLVASLNEGLRLARAPLVARMDADDICLPQRLALQVEAFNANMKLSVLGAAVYVFQQSKASIALVPCVVGAQNVAKSMEKFCALAHPSVMYRRDAVLGFGGYREVCRHAEDYDLWLRMLDKGCMIDNMATPLLKYRLHVNSASVAHRTEQTLAVALALTARKVRIAEGVDPLSNFLEAPTFEASLNYFKKLGYSCEFCIYMLEALLRHFEFFSLAQASMALNLTRCPQRNLEELYALCLRCAMRTFKGGEKSVAIRILAPLFRDPLTAFKVLRMNIFKKLNFKCNVL